MNRAYMPTKGATAALVAIKDILLHLENEPPTTPADLKALRHSIAELLEVIDGYLQLGKPAAQPSSRP